MAGGSKKGVTAAILKEIKVAESLGKSVDIYYLYSKLAFTNLQIQRNLKSLVTNNIVASIRTGDGFSTIYSLNLTILTKRSLPRNTKSCVLTYSSGKRVPYLSILAALDAIKVPASHYNYKASISKGQPIHFDGGYILEVGDYNQ